MDRKARLVRFSSPTPEETVEPFRLGPRVRGIRRERDWTLEEVSNRTGIARSTLSKIENEQVSPSFEAVQKLVAGMGIDIPQLFVPSSDSSVSGRRTFTAAGTGRPRPTPTYEHELLCTELINKKMVPFRTTVRARSFDDFDDWVRHAGEEFLYVLDGDLIFYSEFYEPLPLTTSDAVYYDSAMGHILVSTGTGDAEILWVTTT